MKMTKEQATMKANNLEFIDFLTNVIEAMEQNNIKRILQLFDSTDYPSLTLDKREELIFQKILASFTLKNVGEEILNYLIFDYKIKEENSINTLTGEVEQKIKEMFEKRKINDALVKELDDRNVHPVKRPKV
jgi:ArsR family metal-binding transcriptional regulator